METEWNYECPRPQVPRGAVRIDEGKPPGVFCFKISLKDSQDGIVIKRFYYVRNEKMAYILADDGFGKTREAYKHCLELNMAEAKNLVRAVLAIMKKCDLDMEAILRDVQNN